jgi:hypothetical protein
MITQFGVAIDRKNSKNSFLNVHYDCVSKKIKHNI